MKLFWPQQTPPDASGWPQRPTLPQDRTGIVPGAADTPLPLTKLCSAVFPKPTPTVVEIVVTSGTSYETLEFVAEHKSNSVHAEGEGTIVIEYGSGSFLQRVTMDLRSGSYQLPPAEQIRVFVATAMGEAETLSALVAVGCIVEGCIPFPTVPTYTKVVEALTAVGGSAVSVPNRARYVDLWLANTSGTVIYGPGAPVLSLHNSFAFPQLVRDYVTGIFVPPYEARCIQAQQDTTELALDTTVNCEAVVQFFLEL